MTSGLLSLSRVTSCHHAPFPVLSPCHSPGSSGHQRLSGKLWCVVVEAAASEARCLGLSFQSGQAGSNPTRLLCVCAAKKTRGMEAWRTWKAISPLLGRVTEPYISGFVFVSKPLLYVPRNTFLSVQTPQRDTGNQLV